MTAEAIAHLAEQLEPLGQITWRRMFGGWSLYCDGVIFAIWIDDQLWLKVGDGNRSQFQAAGARPFTYVKKTGQVAVMRYWSCPDMVLDDPQMLADWVRGALAVEPPPKRQRRAPRA